MNIEKVTHFVSLVQQMRDAQKEFFRYTSRNKPQLPTYYTEKKRLLEASKALEIQVDTILKAEENTPNLFNL